MATEPLWNRRTWLSRIAAGAALGGLGCLPLAQAARWAPRFAAAWEKPDGGWRVGVLGSALKPAAEVEVPTRAHGLFAEKETLLAVARRPGDWLLRWNPRSGSTQWAWIDADRAFNGHAIASADGQRIYSTETDLETGAGLIGVRDARSLEKLAEWKTGGMDPHELVLDTDGSVLVANGGIPTLPETGRLKIGLERMDASLVRLDAGSGQVRGQWRLANPRLSLRHLAWGERAGTPVLGIALQAEHADPQQRSAAPLLALFDGLQLEAMPAPRPLAGYGGDIAFAGGRFAVSCPRAHGLALYDAAGRWLAFAPLDEACPLAADGETLWAGGRTRTLALAPGQTDSMSLGDTSANTRLDNHWQVLFMPDRPHRPSPFPS